VVPSTIESPFMNPSGFIALRQFTIPMRPSSPAFQAVPSVRTVSRI